MLPFADTENPLYKDRVMLTAYRRHSPPCKLSMGERKCKCPVWVNGRSPGKFVRRSLKTRNWERGQLLVRQWEKEGIESVGVSVADACERFIEYQKARNLRPPSIWKYDLLCRELKTEFKRTIGTVSCADLQDYQASWKMSPVSRMNKLSRLKKFFRFCMEQDYIRANPTRFLVPPIFERKQAIPFSPEELEKILWATELYPDNPKGRRKQVRAFVLALRFTGLRMGDTVSLKKESVAGGKLHLRTAKTGTGVWLPLKPEVIEALEEIRPRGDYFFWSGEGTLKSAISSWHRSMAMLFKLAGVKGHPHQFRHSFSVELLSLGVPIEDVAALLGHSSSAITAKYHNAFVKRRQDNLTAAVEKAWKLS